MNYSHKKISQKMLNYRLIFIQQKFEKEYNNPVLKWEGEIGFKLKCFFFFTTKCYYSEN